MKKWVILTLLGQAAFFGAWWFLESRKVSQGREAHGEFLLETVPVDPRSLLSGDYMALRPAIADASRLLPPGSAGSPAALLLEAQSQVICGGRSLPLYRALSGLRPAPAALPEAGPGRLWVRALNGPNARLAFGIERYYFSEAREEDLRPLPGGHFYARVVAAPDGSLKLLGLEKK
jgi:uncharacterized membrane-anchored protein